MKNVKCVNFMSEEQDYANSVKAEVGEEGNRDIRDTTSILKELLVS